MTPFLVFLNRARFWLLTARLPPFAAICACSSRNDANARNEFARSRTSSARIPKVKTVCSWQTWRRAQYGFMQLVHPASIIRSFSRASLTCGKCHKIKHPRLFSCEKDSLYWLPCRRGRVKRSNRFIGKDIILRMDSTVKHLFAKKLCRVKFPRNAPVTFRNC